MSQETSHYISQLRQVSVELLLAGSFDPRLYPHRHLAVIVTRGTWRERLAAAMAAADVLAPAGFELSGIMEFDHHHAVCPVFCRK